MLRGARMLVAARSMRTLDNMRRDVCAAQQWPLSLSVSCASGRMAAAGAVLQPGGSCALGRHRAARLELRALHLRTRRSGGLHC